MNELSNNIDLESTLIRAEALFKRFQRTVDACDKKTNFPTPTLRHRSTASSSKPTTPTGPFKASSATDSSPGASKPASPASGAGASSLRAPEADAKQGEPTKGAGKQKSSMEEERPVQGHRKNVSSGSEGFKVISDELRVLLSRKVNVLSRKIVRREGEGVAGVGKGKGK